MVTAGVNIQGGVYVMSTKRNSIDISNERVDDLNI